ncbi:molybdopterin-binding domain-containing protein [Paludibaculum fermentans]|uniref:Molybdopterin-dependent oxidoreductase n=1 Tax=Paludibaculum fermentans TaxID=1473598 RepID=A0A7S7NTG3_PALFE|nr:molybdopterin-dependent oxidoreductase [Paludibaculum fermentans]QOY89506.1 molybdopterin-dependent oxidoreductase [Paludibaculum fermentans]
MKPTRRDLITLSAGAVVALPFTPIPWKLLDDSAIWTQNWPWIPTPARGEPSTKFTACTLCPAACGLKVRCIAGKPVGIAPVAAHPVSRGGLCALAFGAHQLPWHPLRLKQPLLRGQLVTMDQAQAAVAAELKRAGASVAFLDARPGRTASMLYRRFLQENHSVRYLTVARPGESTGHLLRQWSGSPEPLGIDIENAKTILSFGVPVLDGWATPGRVLTAWKRKSFRLIQVDSIATPTAGLADRWLLIEPGTEAALAQALAGTMPVEAAAKVTGLSAALIQDTARELASAGPALVLGDDPAIAALNVQLQNVGRAGGYVSRRGSSVPAMQLEAVPDGSLELLFVEDDAAPWNVVQKKLSPTGYLVCFSAYHAGLANHAPCVIPVPANLETVDDAAEPFDALTASYSVAQALLPAPQGVTAAHAFLGRLAGWAEDEYATTQAKRVAAIHAAKRGSLFDPAAGSTTAVSEFKDAAKLQEALQQGGCWQDDAAAPRVLKCTVPATPAKAAAVQGSNWTAAVLPPLATKIYQESTLRPTREI